MTVIKMNWRNKATWLLLVFGLSFLENRSINAERISAGNQEDKLLGFAQKTSETASQTLVTVGTLVVRFDGFGKQIAAAQKSNNATAVAQLEKEKDKTKTQLLLSLAYGMYPQLWGTGGRWKQDSETAYVKATVTHDRNLTTAFNQERSNQVRPLLATAAYLYEQLLEQIPPNERTEDNKKTSLIFAKSEAGEMLSDSDVYSVAYSLKTLADTVSKKLSAAAKD
jgi:hypothetical protein